MTETKRWWASKTIWGSIIAVVSLFVGAVWGTDVDPATQERVVNLVVAIGAGCVELVGIGVAIVGRITADKRIE